ncbi:hypothetical protein GYB59_02155 [bacterium]|nr:hypothetical protein [bacterium]
MSQIVLIDPGFAPDRFTNEFDQSVLSAFPEADGCGICNGRLELTLPFTSNTDILARASQFSDANFRRFYMLIDDVEQPERPIELLKEAA